VVLSRYEELLLLEVWEVDVQIPNKRAH
jgi:hypothetical protein